MNNIDLDEIKKYYDRVCLDANLMCDVYINPQRNHIEVTVFDIESDVSPTDEMLENADTLSAETKYYSNDDTQSVLDRLNDQLIAEVNVWKENGYDNFDSLPMHLTETSLRLSDSTQDTDYRIRMDNKVVDVYETNALFYKVYVETDINDNGLLYVSINSGDITVEAWADTTAYNDDDVFTLITEDLESQLDGVMARYERSSEDTSDEILDAIEELYDYLEGVVEMWTNYDSWAEEDEE